jgi:hypothetical protein
MMVELALESNSTEPKGVWQDFGSVAAAFDPGAGAKFNAHFERMWGATEPSGATRGPKRALEGPPLHGDDWTAGLLDGHRRFCDDRFTEGFRMPALCRRTGPDGGRRSKAS